MNALTVLELELLDLGRKDLAGYEQRRPRLPNNKYLCSTVISLGSNSSLSLLLSNARIIPCDWVILFFNVSNEASLESVCKEVRSVTTVVACRKATIGYSDIHRTIEEYLTKLPQPKVTNVTHHSLIPKQVFYRDLLNYTANYKTIVVLDSDIDYKYFNFSFGMEIKDCVFNHPPLVVQPQITRNTISKLLYTSTWEGSNDILAAKTFIVEQQTPIFDARFFEWFVNRLLNVTFDLHILHGNDWGADMTWCTAALFYGREVLGWSNYSTPCAVIIGAGYVDHVTSLKVVKKTEGYMLGGRIMRRFYMDTFPNWFYKMKKLSKSVYREHLVVKTSSSLYSMSTRLICPSLPVEYGKVAVRMKYDRVANDNAVALFKRKL